MKILDGRALAQETRDRLHKDVEKLRLEGIEPTLQVFVVGGDPSSDSYLRGLDRASTSVQIGFEIDRHPSDVSQRTLEDSLRAAADDPSRHGIMIHTPLPPHLDVASLTDLIPVNKDVDGASAQSAGRLSLGLETYVPATAVAVMDLLAISDSPLEGKRAVMIGRSATVGKPLAQLLLAANATVTICHSRTQSLSAVAQEADVLVVAIGRAKAIDKTFVKPGAVVIDVGINELDGKLVGDVDAESVAEIAGALSPVPGGVGPLTNVALLRNVLSSANHLNN